MRRTVIAALTAVLLCVPSATAGPQATWPNDSSWRHLGPAAFGGRVDDIEAVADDSRIMFVGSASGGLFRSRDNGITWDAVLDATHGALSVGDIAIAPSDRKVVWVGTGEPNGRQSSTWGDGVYRSLDEGTTWQHMGLRETQTIGRIVIDPVAPSTVFVAALGHLWGPNEERGLYRTRDAGQTWQKVLGVDANTGVVDVAIAPDGRTLVAATYQRRRRAFGFAGSGPGSRLWRSLDGGDTWSALSAGLPNGDIGRIGVAIAASDPSVVYAVIEHRTAGGVYRSSDHGATWAKQNGVNPRPSYYSQIRVDPTNADRVWLLGTYVLASRDAGKTFALDSAAHRGVHPDHHALWIDPRHPEHMLLGNDGGLYATYDGARHWGFVDNLPIAQFYDVAVDTREPYWIYGGAQDNGQWALPSRTFSRGGMTNADVVNTGYADGFRVAVDPRDSRWIYTESQNGRLYLVDQKTRQERWITPISADAKERFRFNWNTPLLLSPSNPDVIYYGAHKLLRTTDRGSTWQVMSPDLTTNPDWRHLPLGAGFPDRAALSRDDGITDYGTITTIDESHHAPGTLLVGTDDGNVQMTTDGGAHWTNLTARFPMPGRRWVSQVLASRHAAGTAFVAFDGHNDDDMTPYVFRTTDGGLTWQSIASDLPHGVVVKALEEDPRNPDLLFAGTEFGLYRSRDAGRHWEVASGNLPRVIVDRVIVNARTNDLILATHGRGMIVLDDISPWQSKAAQADEIQLHPIRPATEVYLWRDLPWAPPNAFVAPNPASGAYVTYSLPRAVRSDSGNTPRARIQVSGADGAVVRELSGPGDAGTHRVVWDLRTQLPFVPPASDSGYYGAPRAPFVMPGTYTIKLSAGGREATEHVEVRADPRTDMSPEASRQRTALATQVGVLSGTYLSAARSLAAADSELSRIRGVVKARANHPAALDSAVAAATRELATLRARLGSGYSAPIGRAFDVLGALESSSSVPTEAEQRVLDGTASDLRDAMTKLTDFVTRTLPALRARVGAPPRAALDAPASSSRRAAQASPHQRTLLESQTWIPAASSAISAFSKPTP